MREKVKGKDVESTLNSISDKTNSEDTFAQCIRMKLIKLKVGCIGRKADPIGNFYLS
jgi:hypothetical protein